MRVLFITACVLALCGMMQQATAQASTDLVEEGEVRQAVRIDAPSELPQEATAPASPVTDGGAGLALPNSFDEPKLDIKSVAQAPAPAPVPATESSPEPVMPACDDPQTVQMVEENGALRVLVSPICAEQVRLSLTDREGAIAKPAFDVIDRTLRVDLPCGRRFKTLKLLADYQPISVALSPREVPCTEEVVQVAQPVAPPAPVGSSSCGNAFEATIDDGILSAAFTGCTAGETITLSYRGVSFETLAAEDGSAVLRLPLLAPQSQVETADGAIHDVTWPEANQTIRVVLAWSSSVDLDLYVLEPGVSYDTFEAEPHVSREGAAFGTAGQMVVTSDGADAATFEVYDSPQNAGLQGMGAVVVADVSRGMTPSGAFCEGGDLAGPEFRVLIGGAEAPDQARFAFEKAECGSELTRGQYYRRVNDIRPFW
ncbi:hypothetical protein [Donghicola sp. XS_ASV15]|uniref:hypothetical protein n=1 Tax=Donghicola sp. XS_ASV15 TaxID=3241295 RepID=UPI003519A4E2